jgi:hypothetical protein
MEPMVPHLLGTMLLPRYPCGYLYISPPVGYGIPYGLYAVSRCLFRPRHYYPGLVSLSCSCASTSTPGISVHHPGVCCYGSTGPLHTSTGTSPGTPYLAYPGIRGGYPQDAISGHLGGGMSGYPSQDTPYEVIPLVGGSMDTMPRYLSGGIL